MRRSGSRAAAGSPRRAAAAAHLNGNQRTSTHDTRNDEQVRAGTRVVFSQRMGMRLCLIVGTKSGLWKVQKQQHPGGIQSISAHCGKYKLLLRVLVCVGGGVVEKWDR